MRDEHGVFLGGLILLGAFGFMSDDYGGRGSFSCYDLWRPVGRVLAKAGHWALSGVLL